MRGEKAVHTTVANDNSRLSSEAATRMAGNTLPHIWVASDTMGVVTEAQGLAERLVRPLGRRWDHVQGVASTAAILGQAVPASDRKVLVAAAWLHDIGYAPAVSRTGFHPLDGALRRKGGPTRP